MSCFSKQILDYFYNIQNTGRIIKPEAIGKAGSKKEGTVIEFSWRVKDEIIEDARFRTFGDVNAIAISSIITTMMIGKSINDVLNITADDVLEHLQSSESNHLYIIDVALNALINTYENYIKKFAKANPNDKKVNEFAENLRKNLEKIENGEEFTTDNYDLSNVAIEDNDEDSYLQNLQDYTKNVEENSIEKSLTRLLQGYTTVDATGEKETIIKSQPKQSTGTGKRGRPRKERTAEELEELANKVVRGRGRPRRERTPEEIEAELSKPIRGRGRPKKQVEESEEPQIKKTRGRPKKELTPKEQEELANKVLRGRGRPRKEKSQEELEKAQNEIKRGRGRPKKIQLFNLFDDEAEIDRNADYNDYMTSNYGSLSANNSFSTSTSFADFDYGDNSTNDSSNEITDVSYQEKTESILPEIKKGRGRPKKERTPEELEALANKVVRGRGRPKKNIDESDNIPQVKKGRGRPRKELSIEEQEELANKPVRGRGRPKKQLEESEEPKIKKTRGRPKKQEDNLQPIEEKKGRGRPRRERTPEELKAELNKVKRGRGRPKKQETSIFRITKLSEDTNQSSEYNNTNSVASSQDYMTNSTDNQDNNSFDNSTDTQRNNFLEDNAIDYDSNYNGFIDNSLAKESSSTSVEDNYDFGNDNNHYSANEISNEKTKPTDSILQNADNEYNSYSFGNSYQDKGFKSTMETKKGRGRPRKELSIEEQEALANKVVRGRGRPKKELSVEEQEELANKPIRGRGRPKKQVEEVGEPQIKKTRGRPRKEDSSAEIVDNVNGTTNNIDEENTEEVVAEQSSSRGRGRPRKQDEDNSSSQESKLNAGFYGLSSETPVVEETPKSSITFSRELDETPNVTIEDTEHHFATLENSFAPAQNKYGVGISKSTQYNVSIKKTKITKTFATDTTKETSNNRIGGSVIRNYDKPQEEKAEETEENREPLSDNVNNLLKNSSIQDALKALLGEDDK